MKTMKLLFLISALTASTGLLFGAQGRVSIPFETYVEGTKPAALFKEKKLTLEEVDAHVQQRLDIKRTNHVKILLDSPKAKELEEEARKTDIPANEFENAYAYLVFLAKCEEHFPKEYYQPQKINKLLSQAEAFISSIRTKEPKLAADLEEKALKLGLIQHKAKKPEEMVHPPTEPGKNKTQGSTQSTARRSKFIRWLSGGLVLAGVTAAVVWYLISQNKKSAPQAKKAA